jgi:hypothetical protein
MDRKVKPGPVWGAGASGKGEDVGKGYRRVNVVEMLCIHVWKWKNVTCWNFQELGGGDKGEWWRGEVKCNIL